MSMTYCKSRKFDFGELNNISIVSGPGHLDYPGHLGHILSRSSGSYPLHRISGSDLDEIKCDYKLTSSIVLMEIQL